MSDKNPSFSLLCLEGKEKAKHVDLQEEDVCYYWRSYTTGESYHFGETNDLIKNFKISVSELHRQHHKQRAIEKIAEEFKSLIPASRYKDYTFVPIPPSNCAHDPEYDDRLFKVLTRVKSVTGTHMDLRKLVLQKDSIPAAHQSSRDRPSLAQLCEGYLIDDTLLHPTPKRIIIFDDVLTKGSHFKAVKHTLQQYYADISIIGLFIARAVVR